MATLRDYYNTGDDNYQTIWSTVWVAQTFTTSESYNISSVKLKLFRLNNPGTITVSIKATSGGLPSGGDLAVGTTDGSTLTTSVVGEWREITFGSPYTLSSGVKYAIVVRSGASAPNYFYWKYDVSSPTYTGGSYIFSSNSGSSWAANTAIDFMFETWGDPIKPGKPTNPSPSDAASGITLDESPLSWDASDPAADTYEIYFGESGSEVLIGIAQAEVEFTIDFGTLDYGTTYGWRIDATNEAGTTTGDTWTFSTILFNTILPGSPGGSGGGGGGGGTGEESSPTGENNMITLRRLVAAANSKIWYEDV